MVREIIKGPAILSQISTPIDFATERDALANLIQDLMDTANANKKNCAGLAAIQIGIPKKVILVNEKGKFVPYINPTIVGRSRSTYCVEEGCLSLDGKRTVKRHHDIKVVWRNKNGKPCVKVFSGYVAEILQHEIDHCNGILI